MKIAVCDRCQREGVEGLLCRHCDTSYCYDCLDLHPEDIRLCKECGEFICDECVQGMIECDLVKRERK